MTARHARAEAEEVLGDGHRARVLEPSPPFDDRDPAYLADDPSHDDRGLGAPADGPAVVSPVTGSGIRTWADVVDERPALTDWAADRWLAAWRPLATEVPAGYHRTRVALHRVALYALSDARMGAIGKMALRHTHGGFGTPFFGPDDRQVRVEGTELIDQRGEHAGQAPLTTLGAAAGFLGVAIDTTKPERFDVPEPGDPDLPLDVDPAATRFLADWFGFAWSVLEQTRADTPATMAPTRPQLWPEHFDPAFEAGDEAAGRRAGFGASPGDHHDDGDPEPYLYVSLWSRDDVPDDPFWNVGFGAKLPFADLVAAPDHREAALGFFARGRSLLAPT